MPSKTIVGLDIGSTHIRGVEAVKGSGPLKIKAMASVALQHGVVELGDIKDMAAFTQALKDLWQKGKFTTKEVRIVSNSQSNITRLITLDWERDFKKTLPFKLKGEGGMFDASEYYLGYHTIHEYIAKEEDRKSAEGFKEVRKKDILLAGGRRETTDSLLSAFKAAGLKPVSIDLAPLALMRAENVADHENIDGNGAMNIHINIGASITTLVFSVNGQPVFLRSIADVGGNTITRNILRELPHADFEYAEKIKFDSTEMLPLASVYESPSSSMFAEDDEEDSAKADAAAKYSRDQMDVYPIIVEEVSAIIDNIHQSIEFFINTNRMGIGRNINKIFLSGGTARFSQIRSRLEREIGSGEAVYTQPLTYLAEAGKGNFDKKYLEKEFDYVLPIGALLGNGDAENG